MGETLHANPMLTMTMEPLPGRKEFQIRTLFQDRIAFSFCAASGSLLRNLSDGYLSDIDAPAANQTFPEESLSA